MRKTLAISYILYWPQTFSNLHSITNLTIKLKNLFENTEKIDMRKIIHVKMIETNNITKSQFVKIVLSPSK